MNFDACEVVHLRKTCLRAVRRVARAQVFRRSPTRAREARFRFLLPNSVSAAGPVAHLALLLPPLLEGSSYKSMEIFIVVISRKHDESRPKHAQHHEQGMIGYESSFAKITFTRRIS